MTATQTAEEAKQQLQAAFSKCEGDEIEVLDAFIFEVESLLDGWKMRLGELTDGDDFDDDDFDDDDDDDDLDDYDD